MQYLNEYIYYPLGEVSSWYGTESQNTSKCQEITIENTCVSKFKLP